MTKKFLKSLILGLTLAFISIQSQADTIEYRMNHPLPFWSGRVVANVPSPTFHYSPSFYNPWGMGYGIGGYGMGFGLGGVTIYGGYRPGGYYGYGYGLRTYSPFIYRAPRVRMPRADYRMIRLNEKITKHASAKIQNYYNERALMNAPIDPSSAKEISQVTINIVDSVELDIPMEDSMRHQPKEIKASEDNSVIMKTY